MSYFQKYQKSSIHSKNASTHTYSEQSNHSPDFKKNSQSRQSYLKAFKKYYIQKLLQKRHQKSQNKYQINNKQNFSFHQTKSQQQQNPHLEKELSNKRQEKQKKQVFFQKQRGLLNEFPKMKSKLQNIVKDKDSELQQVLFNSISQIERQMISFGQNNDLTRQNTLLKNSISKLKVFLKEKLEQSLKKNKQQLTVMFDQYSKLIKKLLEDKESLTEQLQNIKKKQNDHDKKIQSIQRQYENKIRLIVEQNNTQISNTKSQIEQFLQMISQYEEQANEEKAQLERLRQKVVQLEMENDKLIKNQQCYQHENEDTFKSEDIGPLSQTLSQVDLSQMIAIFQKLQTQNNQLKQFLKTCRCSMIKSKDRDMKQSRPCKQEELVTDRYEKLLLEAEQNYARQQMQMRQALKKKDQCIDRLNLIIEQLRRSRYESVDKITQEKISLLKN